MRCSTAAVPAPRWWCRCRGSASVGAGAALRCRWERWNSQGDVQMLRTAVLFSVVFAGLAPAAVVAQAPASIRTGFAYCSVTDTGTVPAKVWASPVVEVSYHDDASGWLLRSNELASDFLRHVGSLGGAGTKDCALGPGRDEALAQREQQRALWSKRPLLIKVGSWREVEWTPPPWNAAAQVPTQVTRYFYCYQTQVDVPDRSDLARTVASQIFAMPTDADPLAVYAQSAAYAEEFKQTVRAHGLPDEGTTCTAYDTQAEAGKASRDYRRLFGGFNTKFTDVAWTPSGRAPAAAAAPPALASAAPSAAAAAAAPRTLGVRIAPVTAELVLATGLPSARGAWIVEVIDGSVAMHAGIKPMDVLLEIDGRAVGAAQDVPALVAGVRTGVPVPAQVWRDRRMQQLSLLFAGGTDAAVSAQVPAAAAPTTE
ncbi:PDZ domain-containing protein [Xanthomonas sp. NCPPB 2654]|uniref:PDZ domain-containing protein n=1 Tax=unclassified Xanthomonas TaxID=2643310 RepID=UPI0021E0C4EE|nr:MULTISPECIES: PDZ domain-containing protein [unclassified Xanthomonas]MDL5367009.1 PDZ domain-containing protein [Xanthomonas sp. NCPPB 2654]UYC21045.1 PDZ domain-containing protein [Xanthomonas sp. CFBP 8443]